MRARLAAAFSVGMILAAQTVAAQEPTSIAFGIYYRCDQSRETRADEIMEQTFAPVYDKHLNAGHLSAWGWAAHRQGGAWRRLAYMIGTDRDLMFDVRGQIFEELRNDHASALRELNSICPSHDDYIWNTVATSQEPANLGQERPDAGLSTYYVCNFAREQRADEIFTEVIAPVIDKHVALGHLNSWSWLEHDIGGRFRRALVIDGADHKTILNMRDAITSELRSQHSDAITEFSEICGWHTDYLWDILISHPEM